MNLLKDLIIIGASGFAREVAWLVERINNVVPTWNLLGFMVKDVEADDRTVDGYSVLAESKKDSEYAGVWYVCAIGAAEIRRDVIAKYIDKKFATLIDPSVLLSNRAVVGEGTIICAGTIITVDISIGNHVIINVDCTIGHDTILNDFVTLYPSVNISGLTNIGEGSEIGTGTQVIQMRTIGSGSIIGAGSVVVKDIPNKCTAVGSPAKAIKFFD